MKKENKLLRLDLIIDNEDESVKSEISGRLLIKNPFFSRVAGIDAMLQIRKLPMITDVTGDFNNNFIVDFREESKITNPMQLVDLVEKHILRVI